MAPQNLNIDTLDYRHHTKLYLKLKGGEREKMDVDFGLYPDILISKYLDVYDGVYAEMVYANKVNENSDLSTTYLGQTKMMRGTKIKAEERFPITGQDFASGKLLGGTECQFYWTQVLQNPTCQNLTICDGRLYMHYQKFTYNMQRIQVGNGQYVSVLFVIHVIIEIHGHRFETFTLVSKIHDKVDLVMGMKNIFELEGVIDLQNS